MPGDAAELELANMMRSDSPDDDDMQSDMGTFADAGSRSNSACTTLSSQSSIDETIQWKKGNVLGKGAFGVVSVKYIEQNHASNDFTDNTTRLK